MRIIIAGCGKIGAALTRLLLSEGHEVTVTDIVPKHVDEFVNVYDVQGVYGNAADPDTLREVKISQADVFIAVTGSDELNMLACLFARKMGAAHTIARIRNTDYNTESLSFIKQELHLSMALNPDDMAAHQLFNILKLPSAVQIETFRNIEMVQLKIKAGSVMDGAALLDLRKKINIPFLVCTVERGDSVFIPDGRFVLQSGDTVGIVAAPQDFPRLLKKFDLMHKQARNIMILGGSRTAYYLARKLSFIGNTVKVIDKDEKRCKEMAALMPSLSMIHGDGTHQELLFEEGIRNMDAFIALTGTDEENILLSVFAQSINVPTVITKVNSDELARIAGKLGLDHVISPKRAVADAVSGYVRALHNSAGSKIETLYRIADEKAEALEFLVEADFRDAGIPLKDMQFKSNTLIAGIVRDRRTIIPSGADCILPGDRVIAVTAGHSCKALADIIK